MESRKKEKVFKHIHYDMNYLVEGFVADKSPSKVFIAAYRNMLKASKSVVTKHEGYKLVGQKRHAMKAGFARVKKTVEGAEQSRCGFKVSVDVLEWYVKEKRKIAVAEDHIEQIDGGHRLQKWQGREAVLLARIKVLKTKISCCKELDMFMRATAMRDKYETAAESVSGCSPFKKKDAWEKYRLQDVVVKEFQKQYTENEFRVEIKELEVELVRIQAKIELYTNQPGELVDKQRAIIVTAHTAIEQFEKLVLMQLEAFHRNIEPACMDGVIQLYTMFMQFKNMFDHDADLVTAKTNLDECMQSLECSKFSGFNALDVYQNFVNSRGSDHNRVMILDDDFKALDTYLRHSYRAAPHANHASVTTHTATLFSHTVTERKHTELTVVETERKAAANDNNGKGKEEEVVVIGGSRNSMSNSR